MPERTGDLVSIERLIENEDLGIDVLHPGGLALSTEFARQCHIRNGTEVLEVASGAGETACLLAADFGARVTGLDISQGLLLRARRRAGERSVHVGWIRGDAQSLPFRDAQFDAVISECAVCNLDKFRALREMQRVARPGATVGMHDLCWKAGTSELLKQRLKELEGEAPETGEGWKALFEEAGLAAIEVHDHSDLIPTWIREVRAKMGFLGYIRIVARVWRKWGLAALVACSHRNGSSAVHSSGMPWLSEGNLQLGEERPARYSRATMLRENGSSPMNATLIKALIALVLGGLLLPRAIALFRRERTLFPLLQLVGAASLIVVVLTHIFEALRAFPSMGWGRENSVGHYVDLCSAILAVTLFPLGFLMHTLKTRRSR
jgi:hypothetical protein